jgi:hypothetical protein
VTWAIEKGTGRRIFLSARPLPANYGIEGEGQSWMGDRIGTPARIVDVLGAVVEPGAA